MHVNEIKMDRTYACLLARLSNVFFRGFGSDSTCPPDLLDDAFGRSSSSSESEREDEEERSSEPELL